MLRDALWGALSGGQGRAPSAGHSPAGLVGYLAGLVGSKAAAARVLGVSPSTVYRWSRGESRPKMPAQAIAAAIRAYVVAKGPHPDILRTAGPNGPQLHIHGTVRVSSDTRARTLSIGATATARDVRAMLRAWVAADDAKANRIFDRILDKYTRSLTVETIDSMWFRK